jgi:hypothetical protein
VNQALSLRVRAFGGKMGIIEEKEADTGCAWGGGESMIQPESLLCRATPDGRRRRQLDLLPRQFGAA